MNDEEMREPLEDLFSDISPPPPEGKEPPPEPPAPPEEPQPEPEEEAAPLFKPSDAEGLQIWREELIHGLLRVLVAGGGLVLLAGSYNAYMHGRIWAIPVYLGAYAVSALLAFWRQVPYEAQVIVLLDLLYGLGVLDLFTAGRSGDGRLLLLTFTLVAALFFGQRGGIVALVLSGLTLAGFTWAFSTGRLVETAAHPTNFAAWVSVSVVFLGLGTLLLFLQTYLLPRLADALDRSRELSAALKGERSALEERTRALKGANETLRRRALQLETSVEVGGAITSVLEIDQLLRKAVELIQEHFGWYLVAIFLLDESGERVVLRAATGEVGAQITAEGLQLEIAESSLVGWTAKHRRAYFASDVEEDEIYRPHPLLPETASEVTLPLMVGERLLGVLDVEAKETAAFDEVDVQVLQGLADQVAVAIQNARRISDETALLEAVSPIYRASRLLTKAATPSEVADAIIESVAETEAAGCLVVEFDHALDGTPEALLYRGVWRRERRPTFRPGKRLPIAQSPFPIELVSDFWVVNDVMEDDRLPESARKVLKNTGIGALVNIPLQARGEAIGQVVVLRETPGSFSNSSLRLYEALSDQASVALERARLLDKARQRAVYEQGTREIMERVRQTVDMEQALRTTAEGLSRTLDVPYVSIELGVDRGDGRESEQEPEGQREEVGEGG